jgi:ABC-2 type transport system permease protein
MSLQLPKDKGWRLFVRTVIGRAYPRVIGMQRQPTGLIFDVALPLIALMAYVLVYRSIHAPEDFVGFVILGGAMGAFWVNVAWSMCNQFFWEKETGNLALYIIAPASLMAILLGMAIGGIFAAGLRAGAILLLGSLLFHVHYQVANTFQLALIFVLTLTALYAMGMMLSSLFLLFGREASHFVRLSQEPVSLLTGMYFPIRSLNFWVAAAATLIPLTLGLDAMRQLVFSSGAAVGFLSPRLESSALFILTIVFLWTAYRSLQAMERLAIREGKLTESRA